MSAAWPPERIERELAICKAATRPPWVWWTSNSWRRLKLDDLGITKSVAEPYVSRSDGHPDLNISEEDMAFIATARTSLPSALHEILRLRAQVEEIQSLLANENSLRWQQGERLALLEDRVANVLRLKLSPEIRAELGEIVARDPPRAGGWVTSRDVRQKWRDEQRRIAAKKEAP